MAYAGVVCLCMVDPRGSVSVSLVMSKTRVAPIKRLTIPPNLSYVCGAHILAGLLQHTWEVLQISPNNMHVQC